jgi:uncharacterized membrane protein
MEALEFNQKAIKPIECVREAWELIKPNYWILFAISLVGAMLGGISMYVLIGAMVCGIFYAYIKAIDGGSVTIEDLWVGFKYFWPSLPVTIAIFVPVIVFTVIMLLTIYLPIIATAMTKGRGNDSAILGAFAVGLVIDIIVAIVMICIHTLLLFAFPLIVDRGLSSWPAMKLSARAVMKNLGGIGGLMVVSFGIALLGEMAFCIGLYLVIPILTASNIVAYRKVFPSLNPLRLDPPPPTAYQGLT